jgi:large subunit ribosomal protein L4
MFDLPVKNIEGKDIETIKLDDSVFNDKIPASSVYLVINSYRANQRKGLASTKTRGEVSGGGRKPWRQKGTGRARVGSIRSPLWRHGGVIFGPHPRDFSIKLPKKIKNQALQYVLCQKVKEDNIVVIDALEIEKPKTKEMVKILTNLKIDSSSKNVLLLVDKIENNLSRVFSNIDFLKVDLVKKVHTYEVLAARKIIITKAGLKELTQRLKIYMVKRVKK